MSCIACNALPVVSRSMRGMVISVCSIHFEGEGEGEEQEQEKEA